MGLFAADADYGALGAKDKTGLSLEQMLTYAIQDEYLARAIKRANACLLGQLRQAFAEMERTGSEEGGR